MEKVRGKKSTSYSIFTLLVILLFVVIIPTDWFLEEDDVSESIRIAHHTKEETTVGENNEQSAVYFSECKIFGIKKLIHDYYEAYLSQDTEELFKYIDTMGDMSEEEWDFARLNIEQYMDIRCYYMEGYIEDSYLVVTYGYAKYYDINTTVPVIGTFFVRKNSSGNYYVCNSVVSNESSAYNEVMFDGRQVQELREMAQYELDTACEVDEVLRQFVEANKEYFVYLTE